MPDAPRARTGRPPTTVGGKTVPERLLGVATDLFAERGFEGTSVQDVVEAAGVTKGAMYHYFASKDDLLFEIYARVLRLQMARLETFATADGDIAQRVREAAADVVATTVEFLPDMAIFFRSLHQLSSEKQKEVRRDRRRYHELFRSLLEQGQRDGVFRDDIQADLAVDYFFGAVHHLPLWFKPRGKLSATQVGEEFADLLIRGLTP